MANLLADIKYRIFANLWGWNGLKPLPRCHCFWKELYISWSSSVTTQWFTTTVAMWLERSNIVQWATLERTHMIMMMSFICSCRNKKEGYVLTPTRTVVLRQNSFPQSWFSRWWQFFISMPVRLQTTSDLLLQKRRHYRSTSMSRADTWDVAW